jgi:outer membrane protein assembly complex protein YaeT
MQRPALLWCGLLLAWLVVSPVEAQTPATTVDYDGLSPASWQRVVRMLRHYDVALKAPMTRTEADDAAFYLKEVLLEDGFADSEVRYDFGGGRVIFRVSKGEQTMIHKISFSGIPGLRESVSREIVESTMRQETLTPFGAIPFFETAVNRAAVNLAAAIAQQGYLEAAVEPIVTRAGKRQDIHFVATPGTLFTVSQIELTPSDAVPKSLGKEIRSSVGRPFRSGDDFVLRAQLLDGLKDLGHFEAEVTSHVELSPDGRAQILLDANPGRVFSMGSLELEGNRLTSRQTIMRKLNLRAGKTFRAGVFDAALRRLWLTGAFETISPRFEPRPDGTLDSALELEEAKARQFSVTVGYGQWEQGFARLTYSDNNFFGSLNRFSVEAFASFRGHGVVGSLADPALAGMDLGGTLKGFYVRREAPAFDATISGGAFTVHRKFDLRNETSWNAGLEWRIISDSTVFAEDQLDGAPINYSVGAISFGQILDRRNDPLVPMQGFFLNWDGFFASEALLGDVSFLRLRGQATAYIPLQKIEVQRPFVPFLAFNHRIGIIAPFAGQSSVPVQERFFLGGPDTVRSFQLDGMAPRDRGGQPGGGLFFLLANAELQIPVFRALYLVTFVDAGNLAQKLENFDWDDTRIAAGLGARLYTPLGSVRMDYGYNLIRGEGDPTGAWQFGFGFTF